MTYLKATAFGVVSAIVFAAAWMFASLGVSMGWQLWQARNEGGFLGASSVGSGSILFAALVGFAFGFFSAARRTSH